MGRKRGDEKTALDTTSNNALALALEYCTLHSVNKLYQIKSNTTSMFKSKGKMSLKT
jgi:hypothetical protein